MQSLGTDGETQKHALLKPTLTAVPSLLYPQTVLLRMAGLGGPGSTSGDGQTLVIPAFRTFTRLHALSCRLRGVRIGDGYSLDNARRTPVKQGCEVTLRVVRLVGLPATEQDADPFDAQGANGGAMAFAAGPLVLIKFGGPITEADRWPANSWKDWRRNFGQAQRKWAHLDLPPLFLEKTNPKI
jgi:hypothetical protein